MRTLLVLVLCGCDTTSVVETIRIGGDLTQLSVDVEAGDIEVVVADVDVITITRTLTGPAGSVVADQAVSNGVARIGGACRAFAPCRVDVSVVVPADLLIDLHTGEGDVDLHDVADANVEIGRGELHADGVVDRLHARIGWGDATLSTSSVPFDVALALAGGDARVHVPSGTYDMDVVAFGGDAIVGVVDGVGPRLHVRTQAGSASVIGRSLAGGTEAG